MISSSLASIPCDDMQTFCVKTTAEANGCISRGGCLVFLYETFDIVSIITGTIFAYGVTSSGKTHTMHVRKLVS